MTPTERKKIGLLGIEWDSDLGVVDMANGKLVMSAYADKGMDQINWEIPWMTLHDDEFNRLVPQEEKDKWADDPESLKNLVYEYANWDEVVNLLMHPEFEFETNLVKPPPGKCRFGFTPNDECDNCDGTGVFAENENSNACEACAFCLEDAIKRGEIDGVIDGVEYKGGKIT